MILYLVLAAGVSQWVPARWPSGDPKSLGLLTGTPINCLLIESRHGNSELPGEARRHGITTLAVVRPESDPLAQARQAAEWKFSGAVLEGEFEAGLAGRLRSTLADAGMAVIELADRHGVRLDSRDPVVGTRQGLWPGIEIEHGGSVATGPTSTPWINTNSGFLRFLVANSSASEVWIGVSPPPRAVFPGERYAQAIGDAALAGARWIVDLDRDLWRRLLEGEPRARESWRTIARHLAFPQEHPEWAAYRPHSLFAMIQDAGSGGLLSGGLLDLLSAQRTPVRVVPASAVSAERLRGARLLLTIDADSMSPARQKTTEEFRRAGGVVLHPPPGFHFPDSPPGQVLPTRQQWTQMQKIWETAYHSVARKNFGVRLFNTAGTQFNLLATPDGGSLLVELVNYTDFAAESITVQALGAWKRARLYQPGRPVEELPLYPVSDGTGVDIRRMAVRATLRLD